MLFNAAKQFSCIYLKKQEDIDSKKDLGPTKPTPKGATRGTVMIGRNYDSIHPKEIENNSPNGTRRYQIYVIYQTCNHILLIMLPIFSF